MAKIKSLEESHSIVKSNALIETQYRLTLPEPQVILWILSQIHSNDENFKIHKLAIPAFTNLTQVNVGHKYSELRKITKRLMQRVLEIYEQREDRFIEVS